MCSSTILDKAFPRKHQYVDPSAQYGVDARPMSDEAPNWVGFTCTQCGVTSGLDEWQLREMPRSIAVCPESIVRCSPLESLSGTFDCLATPKPLK